MTDPSKQREHSRNWKRRNPERVKEYQRAYHEKNRDKYNYSSSPHRRAAVKQAVKRWTDKNADRRAIYKAKDTLGAMMGVPARCVPTDIAEAKVAHRALRRALRANNFKEQGTSA
jgi:hypothetical protein